MKESTMETSKELQLQQLGIIVRFIRAGNTGPATHEAIADRLREVILEIAAPRVERIGFTRAPYDLKELEARIKEIAAAAAPRHPEVQVCEHNRGGVCGGHEDGICPRGALIAVKCSATSLGSNGPKACTLVCEHNRGGICDSWAGAEGLEEEICPRAGTAPEILQGYTPEQWRDIMDDEYLCQFRDHREEWTEGAWPLTSIDDETRVFSAGNNGPGWLECRPARLKGVLRPWYGGERPKWLNPRARVYFIRRNETTHTDRAGALRWTWSAKEGAAPGYREHDIVAYMEV